MSEREVVKYHGGCYRKACGGYTFPWEVWKHFNDFDKSRQHDWCESSEVNARKKIDSSQERQKESE